MADEEASVPEEHALPEEPSVPDQIREFVGTGVFWATALILIFAASVIAVVVQNTHDVPFEFLWIDTEVPLLTVILFSALISVVCVEVATAVWRLRRRRVLNEREELRRLRGGEVRGSAGRPWRRRR